MGTSLVTVELFGSEIEAELARGLLETAGITAFIFKDDGGGMVPSMQRWTGVRLLVEEPDAAAARDILGAFTTAEDAPEENL